MHNIEEWGYRVARVVKLAAQVLPASYLQVRALLHVICFMVLDERIAQ